MLAAFRFLLKVQIEFEKSAHFFSIACELICLILGTRVEAAYNEHQGLSEMAMWGWGSGRETLKDMKVLITQRSKGEVYVDRERLWNGQTFFHFDCLCPCSNERIVKD